MLSTPLTLATFRYAGEAHDGPNRISSDGRLPHTMQQYTVIPQEYTAV